ncbi:MAG: M48 family metalloprotease [Acidobacteriota bacterium]|nr:M48 family metalloprotease [Acidobacteriota bacterium]
MYFLLGTALIFALLLVSNVAASVSATVLWRAVARRAENWTAQSRARFIFSLRVLPFVAALVFVLVFLVPAYLLFEPHSSGEIVSFKLAFLSIISAAGVGIAFCRIFRTWRATRRLASDWMRHAEAIRISGVSIPVYRIRHSFPVVAVVGAIRPRMFVAEQIFASLDEREFQAAIAHEAGHLAARDNLKRTLMRGCRDLLVLPFGNSLDRAWTENAESSADEYAARMGGNLTALNLAAALIKIARIVPEGAKPTMPAGAFLIEAQTAEIAARVQRLLQIAESENILEIPRGFKYPYRLYSGVVLTVILLIATNQEFLQKIHIALEKIVRVLQ